MKDLPVNLSELQIALESHDGGLGLHTYWFDTQTGQVIFLTEDLEEQDELREQIEEDTDNRFVEIEPLPSHDGFRIMENFVRTLPPSRTREKLECSLGGPKPFRRFKDAVRENRKVLEKWYKFSFASDRPFRRSIISSEMTLFASSGKSTFPPDEFGFQSPSECEQSKARKD